MLTIYNATLASGVTLPSGLDVQVMNQFGGCVARITGSLVNQAIIQANGESSSSYPALIELTGTTTLTGGGTIQLSGAGQDIIRGTGTFINQDNTLQGVGNVGANTLTLTNHGILSAETGNLIIDPAPDTETINQGIIQAANGGSITLQDATLKGGGGLVQALDGSTINFSNNLAVQYGVFDTHGSGSVNVTDSTLSHVLNAGWLFINRVTILDALLNNGTIDTNGTTLAIESGVTLYGVGTVVGEVSNVGKRSIRENGSMTDIQGTYTQASTGTLVIDLSASGAARTVISGSANLEGSLRIVPVNGFIPEAGSQFVVLTASAINGQSDGDIPGPCSMSVDYSATEVTITINEPPAFPSFDADNRVTVLDMVTQMMDSGSCPGCDTDLDCNAFVDEEDIHMATGNWPAQQ